MSNSTEALRKVNKLYKVMPLIHNFIGESQVEVMAAAARGEEREFFIDKMLELAELLETMPKIYEQENKGDEAIVSLHYFMGNMDWFITERDMGDSQYQAFGLADLGMGFPELGYISIAEITSSGAELDLYWTPKTLAQVKAS